MFKFALGVAVTVALVGYGVITTQDLERAGNAVVQGINTGADYVQRATDDGAVEKLTNTARELVEQ